MPKDKGPSGKTISVPNVVIIPKTIPSSLLVPSGLWDAVSSYMQPSSKPVAPKMEWPGSWPKTGVDKAKSHGPMPTILHMTPWTNYVLSLEPKPFHEHVAEIISKDVGQTVITQEKKPGPFGYEVTILVQFHDHVTARRKFRVWESLSHVGGPDGLKDDALQKMLVWLLQVEADWLAVHATPESPLVLEYPDCT